MNNGSIDPYRISQPDTGGALRKRETFWHRYVGLHLFLVAASALGIYVGHNHPEAFPTQVVQLIAPLQIATLVVGPAGLASCLLVIAAFWRKSPSLKLAALDVALSVVHLLIALPTVR